jgi:hypothetical protein
MAGFNLSDVNGFVFIRFFVRAKYRQSRYIVMHYQHVRRAMRIPLTDGARASELNRHGDCCHDKEADTAIAPLSMWPGMFQGMAF